MNYGYLIFPIILGLLGGVIGYFILRRKDNRKYAKYILLIGFIVSVFWTVGIINLGMSTEPEPDYLKETTKIQQNNEDTKQIKKQFPNVETEIQDSKKQIESSKKYQSDIW